MPNDLADIGADGLAMLSRPHCAVEIEGHARGSVATERTTVRRFHDATWFDLMLHQGTLTDAQHEAAERLHTLWVDAGLAPRAQRAWDEATGRILSDEAEGPGDRLRAALRLLRGGEAYAVADMLWHGRLAAWRLPELKAGLSTLAKEWVE